LTRRSYEKAVLVGLTLNQGHSRMRALREKPAVLVDEHIAAVSLQSARFYYGAIDGIAAA